MPKANVYGDQGVDIPTLNAFCRKYDLIFVELGQVRKEPVYWFIDSNNHRCYYSAVEIEARLDR